MHSRGRHIEEGESRLFLFNICLSNHRVISSRVPCTSKPDGGYTAKIPVGRGGGGWLSEERGLTNSWRLTVALRGSSAVKSEVTFAICLPLSEPENPKGTASNEQKRERGS